MHCGDNQITWHVCCLVHVTVSNSLIKQPIITLHYNSKSLIDLQTKCDWDMLNTSGNFLPSNLNYLALLFFWGFFKVATYVGFFLQLKTLHMQSNTDTPNYNQLMIRQLRQFRGLYIWTTDWLLGTCTWFLKLGFGKLVNLVKVWCYLKTKSGMELYKKAWEI